MKFGNFFCATTSIALCLVAAASGKSIEATDESNSNANIGNLRSERKLYSYPAYYYGYGEAKKYWKKKGYKCTSDDVDSFWNKVRKQDICEDQYKENKSFISNCNDGIKDFYKDQKDKCFASVDECEGIGEAISEGIVAMHCILSTAKLSSGRKWPKECKQIGIDQCKKEVSKDKNYEKYGNDCEPPSDSQLKKLKNACEDEVNKYLSGPAPSPTPKPKPPSPTPKPPSNPKYKKSSNTACSSDDVGKWEDKSLSWCEDKCVDNAKKTTCFGYDYDYKKDRCRIFYDYPLSKKSKNGVDCWRANDPWDVCAAISDNADCKDCCKDVEKKTSNIKACQKYAGCQRTADK